MKNFKLVALVFGLTAMMLSATTVAYAQNDLATFGLKGNVQSVKYTNDGSFAHYVPDGPLSYTEVTFNRNGKLTSVNGQKLNNNADLRLVRDAQGRISKVITVVHSETVYKKYVSTFTDVITYDANGRVKRIDTNQSIDNGITEDSWTAYRYDTQGRLYSETDSYTGDAMADKFTDYQTDSHGNWIKCIYTNGITDEKETVTRAITYYTGDAAQNILDFEVELPQTLITAKGRYANIRVEPSTKAGLVMNGEWNVTLQNHAVMSATDAGKGWWKTEKGYISKSVTTQVAASPVPEDRINQHFTGYHGDDMDDNGCWRVGRNKETGLVICEYQDNPYYGLYLGKEINGVFCFKYFKELGIQYDENAKLKVEKEKITDENTGEQVYSYTLKFGPAYAKRIKNPNYDPNGEDFALANEYYIYLDLNRLPKNMIEYLFKEEIENDNVTEYYVNGYMMSSKFEYPYSQW